MNFLRSTSELCHVARVTNLLSRSLSNRKVIRKPLKRFKPTLDSEDLFEMEPTKRETFEMRSQNTSESDKKVNSRMKIFKDSPKRITGNGCGENV